MNKRKMGLWLILTSALFLLSFSIPSKEAHAAKLIHGVQTTYQKKSATTDDSYQDVATQYENTSFDTALNGKPPYTGLIPSSSQSVKVIKTAYISLTETGNYLFGASPGQVYVNNTLVNISSQNPYLYLHAGQIIKVEYEVVFTNLDQNSRLMWRTPSMFGAAQSIPQELLYTTSDLKGIDVDTPSKLVHGVQTTYQKYGNFTGYQDVATQFEDTSFDTALNGKPPYPGLIPSSTAPAKVIKTAYINLMETGIYLFTPNRGQVYVNDRLVSTAGQTAQPIYLEAGKIIKVKYDAPFTDLYQNSQLKWTTPTMPDDSAQFIPQEMIYTTPDLQGIDI